MYIDGYSHLRAPIDVGYVALKSHEYDSLTWCLQHAPIMPKWQNVFYIFKSEWVVPILGALYYISVILAYIALKWETEVIWDAYQSMMIGLQMSTCLATYIEVKSSWHRTFVIMAYQFTTLVYTYITCISFYMLLIKSSIYYAQISTKYKLINKQFRLATDS